jgi:hypothetical protein
MEYDGKRIAVRAGYMLGFEEQVMLSLKCRNLMYLAFRPETRKAEHVFRKVLRQGGTFNATFYGTFHKEMLVNINGIHDSYQFDVHYMNNIEIISKQTEDRDALSKQTQQKLCEGDEVPNVREKW